MSQTMLSSRNLLHQKIPVLIHHCLDMPDIVFAQMPKPSLSFQVRPHSLMPLIIKGIHHAIFYLIERKYITLNRKPSNMDRFVRSDTPARGTCCIHVQKSRAVIHLPSFLKLAHHVFRKSDTGRCRVRYSVGRQNFDNILFARTFPAGPGCGGGTRSIGS